MSTGVMIALIICGTIVVIVAMIVIIALIAWKSQQKQTKDLMNSFKNWTKED